MADERILDPIRRFFPLREDVEAKYLELFTADWTRLKKYTLIVSKSSEGEGAGAQVVVTAEERLQWLDAFRERLLEMDAETAGTNVPVPGCVMVDFSRRRIGT